MDDNAKGYRSKAVNEYPEAKGITQKKHWPGYSPDLNPTEHIWDQLASAVPERIQHSSDPAMITPGRMEFHYIGRCTETDLEYAVKHALKNMAAELSMDVHVDVLWQYLSIFCLILIY